MYRSFIIIYISVHNKNNIGLCPMTARSISFVDFPGIRPSASL